MRDIKELQAECESTNIAIYTISKMQKEEDSKAVCSSLQVVWEALQRRLSELQQAIVEEKDFQAGYRDRKYGSYDKWYRRNRKDEGTAYDRGVVACVTAGDIVTKNFNLIECM